MRHQAVKRNIIIIFLAWTICYCLGVSGQSLPVRTLLVASKVDHMLAVVDPVSLKVIARIPVGPDPHEVIASPDGRTAYVSNPGYGSFHELDRIDLVADRPLSTFDTAPLMGPHGLAFVEGKLWFTAQGSKSIARYDPVSGKVDWTMGTGQDTTHMIYVRPDAKLVATTNVDSGTVSVFEYVLVQPTMPPTGVMPAGLKPHMDWEQTTIPVGEGAEGFDVSPSGQELWTATPQGTVSIIDLSAKRLSATVNTGVLGLHRMKFTPDGKLALIVSVRTGELLVYDTSSRKEVKRFIVGHGASMLIDPVGQRAFIACTPDNDIAIVDLKKLTVAGRIDVGGRPDGMAWAVH